MTVLVGKLLHQIEDINGCSSGPRRCHKKVILCSNIIRTNEPFRFHACSPHTLNPGQHSLPIRVPSRLQERNQRAASNREKDAIGLHIPCPRPFGRRSNTDLISSIQVCCPETETGMLGSVRVTPGQDTGQSVSATTMSFFIRFARFVSDDFRAESVAPAS